MSTATVRVDLHNHSCLSPCGDLSMSPETMARAAKARAIDLFALSDHNSSLNCLPFALNCAEQGLVPLFGIEMNSMEEVHLLALFATPREALEFGEELEESLPRLDWDPATFGDEVVVDERQYVLDFHDVWLGAALDLGFGDLAERAEAAGAIVIPAHVDRAMNSVHSQLGFLPPGPYDAVESMGPPASHLTGGLHAVSGSDAHYPEHVGRRPFLADIPQAPLDAMRKALDGFAAACARPAGLDLEDKEEAAFGGYEALLADPRLDRYPGAEARRLFECLRESLREGRIRPTFIVLPPA